MVRRCGFCREEGHDRRRCQGWIQHEQREADQNYHTIRLGINPPIINQTIIDLSDDYAEIPENPTYPYEIVVGCDNCNNEIKAVIKE